MKWWEIPQNCNCLFALDSESQINSDGSVLNFSNTSDNFLTARGGVKGRIFKNKRMGFKAANHKNKLDSMYIYNTLAIADTNLIFNTPINTTENSTWFLKCILRGKSILSQGDATITYGLLYEHNRSDYEYSRSWTTHNFSTPTLSVEERQTSGDTIHNVVISHDTSAREAIFLTDYGIFTKPVSPVEYFSNQFGSVHDVKMIGYSGGDEWSPKIDIIAYGLFDKVLSKEEIEAMFLQAEDSYKVSEKYTSFTSTIDIDLSGTTLNTNLIKLKDLSSMNNLKNIHTPETGDLTISLDQTPSELRILQMLYSNIKNISDIILEEGIPAVKVKIFLFERNSGILLKTTESNSEGLFTFTNLNEDLEYLVTANDNKYQFSSIIKNYNK